MLSSSSSDSLTVRDPAPDFSLLDQHGQLVSLSSFQGKKNVVLIFYPGDMTPGCTMQLCAVRDDWSKFQKADTVVFGINHGSAESHQAFTEKHGLPFPLLVDKDKKISMRYGAVHHLFGYTIIRRTVVAINMQGIIVYLKHGMPKNTDLFKALHPTTTK